MSALQHPTLQNVRIRSIRDAHQIFYAVARRLLPMTVRRLDAEERRAIVAGNCYVWEERGANSEATGLGIERWTDGMRWSPSRVRDDFLFYHQKESDGDGVVDGSAQSAGADGISSSPSINSANENGQAKWARMVRPREDASASPTTPTNVSPTQRIPHAPRSTTDPEKLIKQTYSVQVSLPPDRAKGITRKWHLTAYFTQATLDSLSSVEEELGRSIGSQGRVQVPEGWFKSARTGKARRERDRFLEREAVAAGQFSIGWSNNAADGHLQSQQRISGPGGCEDRDAMMSSHGQNGADGVTNGYADVGYTRSRPISFVEGYTPVPSLSVNTDVHSYPHAQPQAIAPAHVPPPPQQYMPFPVPTYHSQPHFARHQHQHQHQQPAYDSKMVPNHATVIGSPVVMSSPGEQHQHVRQHYHHHHQQQQPSYPMPRLPPPPSAAVTHSPTVQYHSSRMQIDTQSLPETQAQSQPRYLQQQHTLQQHEQDDDIHMTSPPPSPSTFTPSTMVPSQHPVQYNSGPSLLRAETTTAYYPKDPTPSPIPTYTYPPPGPPRNSEFGILDMSSAPPTLPRVSIATSTTAMNGTLSRLSPPLTPQIYTHPLPPSHNRTRTNSSHGSGGGAGVRDLVPLDCLQSAMGPRRDPTDDLLLRQFGSLTTGPTLLASPATAQAVL